MTNSQPEQRAPRILFGVAAVLLVVALLEAGIQVLGFNFISRYFSAGRLMELAATLILFVIVLLLRQIRDSVRNP